MKEAQLLYIVQICPACGGKKREWVIYDKISKCVKCGREFEE